MIPEDLTAGIVQILSYDGIVTGTGFLVTRNMIATCAHVIESADPGPDNKVTVRFPLNGKELDAIIIPERWRSPSSEDLSILQLEDNLPEDVKVLSLGSSAGLIGHKVCTFGFPDVGEIEGIWSRGEVSGKVIERSISLLQINSNEITEGFSGAPLWDESRHRVIGIVVSIAVTDSHGKLQNIAFAIPSETLLSICPELKIEDICPYRGLLSFKEDDEYLFFGRSKLVQELSEQLRTNPRFLALVGSSGSGKSSLVFAGLLPQIKRGKIVGVENAQVITFRPSDVSKFDGTYENDPEESLRQALNKSGINIEKAHLWEGISSFLEKKPETRLVIYADQFETLFVNLYQAKQIKFIEGIYNLLKSKLKISFLVTVRGDYYDFLLNSLFGEYLSEGQVNIRSMSAEELREAIRKPAEVTGLEIEPGLEDLIIKDLMNTKNPLPLLEFTLTQLWVSKSNGVLTRDNYIKIGGASGAIGQWANEAYNGLNEEEKDLSRKIFTRLVHYGERDVPDSRRRLPMEKLAGDCDEKAVRQLIKKLADAHILVTDSGSGKGNETVEIVHDSLLTEWKQLNKWITEHRGFLTWRQRLEDKMEEWNSKDDEGNLLRGASLAEAKGWMKKFKDEFNPQEIRYIKVSTELEEKEWKEKERNRNRIIKGLAAFSVIILLLATFAATQWVLAEEDKKLAEEKTKEARVSYLNVQSMLLQENPVNMDKSILLAIESFRIHRTSTADQLIRKGLSFIPDNVVVLEHDCEVNKVTFSPDGTYILTICSDKTARIWNTSTGENITVLNQEGGFNDISFSQDGKYVATVSSDKTACVWNASTAKRIAVMNHDGKVNSIVFSPDAKYVATVSSDKTVYIWNPFTGEEIAVLKHDDSVNDVAFSPDAKFIVTVSSDKTAHVWNVSRGESIAVLKHDDSVNDVAFSPDGQYIATASKDNEACVWNSSTGEKVKVLKHNDSVNDVVFSPDGRLIATASNDNTAGIWDISTGKEIVLKHGYSVSKVIFSSDGQKVATTSWDYTARLWDSSTGEEIAVLNHNAMVNDIAFSPDGKYIATACEGKTARLWSTSTGKEIVLKHGYLVNKVTFSLDGKYIATASSDKTACIWNTSSGERITVLKHNNVVTDVAFNPDGDYVVTASRNNTADMWDTLTGEKITLLEHNDVVNDVAFSPDGKYIATASSDKTACVWKAFRGKKVATLKHNDSVLEVAFSQDGKYIVTASRDKTARIWNTSTGENIAVLKHDGVVNDVVFSPDGKYIATASRDNTADVWDAATGKKLAILKHNDSVAKVAFSPDGKQVATASWDDTVCVWDASTGKRITVLKYDRSLSNVIFSPDGKYIAILDYINTMDIWDVSKFDKVVSLRHNRKISDVVFSPDGESVATASDDNTARLWVLSTEDLINKSSNCLTRNLSPAEWKEYMGDEPYHKIFPNLP